MNPPRNQSAVNALRMIPTKWAVVVVGLAIAYFVLQPRLNQWFGWNLPSVAWLTDDEKSAAKKTQEKETASKSTKATAKKVAPGEDDEPVRDEPVSNESPGEITGKQAQSKSPTQSTKPTKKSTADSKPDDSDPLYGFLSEVGRNRYGSPAGLVYGPGSEEGHRLKHIAKHLEDQPDRPGSHGVFKDGMRAFLATIDDAYLRAKKGAKRTTMTEDDGSMVYEVTFDKAIGFIGGEAGKRKKNPASKKLRLVVRGSNVITAFPF